MLGEVLPGSGDVLAGSVALAWGGSADGLWEVDILRREAVGVGREGVGGRAWE